MSEAGRPKGRGAGNLGWEKAPGGRPWRHTLQVKRVRGRGWRVCEIDGTPVSGIYVRQDDAEAFRARREARTGAGPRRCLCCGNGFESEGPGNRLCTYCSRKAASLGRQFQGV